MLDIDKLEAIVAKMNQNGTPEPKDPTPKEPEPKEPTDFETKYNELNEQFNKFKQEAEQKDNIMNTILTKVDTMLATKEDDPEPDFSDPEEVNKLLRGE